MYAPDITDPDSLTLSSRFIAGSCFYLAAWSVHTADHVRRGLFEPAIGVQVLGNLQILLTIGFAWLLWKRHPITPVMAIGIGAPVTLGIAVAHLAPDFGFVSDSLWVEGIDAFTWFAVGLEIIGSATLAIVGWLEWKSVDYAMPEIPLVEPNPR